MEVNLSPDLQAKLARIAGQTGLAQVDQGEVLTHEEVFERRLAEKLRRT